MGVVLVAAMVFFVFIIFEKWVEKLVVIEWYVLIGLERADVIERHFLNLLLFCAICVFCFSYM